MTRKFLWIGLVLLLAACGGPQGFKGTWRAVSTDQTQATISFEFVNDHTVIMHVGPRALALQYTVASDGRAIVPLSSLIGSTVIYLRMDGDEMLMEDSDPSHKPVRMRSES